jgi:hypothetical protein
MKIDWQHQTHVTAPQELSTIFSLLEESSCSIKESTKAIWDKNC